MDYDRSATATKRVFAAVQNKMHYSTHGQTAAEVIVEHADHRKENMGMTSWEGAPQRKIHKYDVSIAKNYLSGFELRQMQRIVSAYLDMAELYAMQRINGKAHGFTSEAIFIRTILVGLETTPLLYCEPALIVSTNSIPDTICPQTVYCPSRNGAGAKQIKNWLSALLGSVARAMETVPRICCSRENSD